MRQRGLANARNIFEKNVAFRKQRGDAELHDLAFAANDALDVRLKPGDLVECRINRNWLAGHVAVFIVKASVLIP